MARRSTTKDELFAQNLFAGMDQLDAYNKAGFKGGIACASRKAGTAPIMDRLAELRAEVAKEAIIDRQWVLDELVKVHKSAFADHQYNASNQSLKLVGQELGMFVERRDIRVHAMFEQVPDMELMQQLNEAKKELLSIANDETVAEE